MKYFAILISFFILLICNQQISADSIATKNKNHDKDTLTKVDKVLLDTAQLFQKDTLSIKVVDNVVFKSEKRDYLYLIFPILTLILGFFLNRGYEFFAEKRRIQKDGDRWIAELRCLDKPLQDQKTSIEDFLKEHAIDKFDTPELIIHEILNCEIFKSLDKTNLLKYLQTKDKDFSKSVDLSNSVHGFISSLNYVSSSLTKRFDEYLKNTSKHFEMFNVYLQQLMQNFAQFGVKIEQETGKDPINDGTYRQIFDLFNEYILPHSEDGNIELFNLQNKFVLPLGDIISQNRLNDDLKEMSVILSNCNMEIKAIRMEKRYLEENFTKIIDHLHKSKENLDKLIGKIE